MSRNMSIISVRPRVFSQNNQIREPYKKLKTQYDIKLNAKTKGAYNVWLGFVHSIGREMSLSLHNSIKTKSSLQHKTPTRATVHCLLANPTKPILV